MSGWQREQARSYQRQIKAAKKKRDKIAQSLNKLGEDAKRLVMGAPPGFMEEMAQRVKERQAELGTLKADPNAKPEDVSAKEKELESAKQSVVFIQATLLDALPTGLTPPIKDRRGR
jgi:predicted  nucleic acid-binding Zn-ribbon protein